MRKSDEVTHDILVKSIGQNPGNASLYRSLSEVQKTMLSIQTKIDDTIKSLNTFMKGYQMEINFNPQKNDEENEQEISTIATKGTKSFIENLKKEGE
jgi:septum formation inhibitor MinC